MRSIGTIPDGDHAERFSDYLLTRDIDNRVEQTQAGDFAVWVENDDQLERAKGELLGFLRNPDDPQYRDAAKEAEKLRVAEEKKQRRLRKRFVDVRTSWGAPQQWAVPVTLALIAISVVISVGGNSIQLFKRPPNPFIEYLMFAPVDATRLAQWQAAHPRVETRTQFALGYWLSTMRTGQVWRMGTDIFVHWSILHLLFNMFWLRDLGGMIERRRGTLPLLALVLVTAVLSNFAEYLWSFPVSAGGMSGVVYGLFGYIWIKQRYQPQLGLGVSQESSFMMIAWLFLCMTGLVGNIANAAHVVGLLVGAAVAYGPVAARKLQRGVVR